MNQEDSSCMACLRPVRPRQQVLQCSGCGRRQHRTCYSGITQDQFRRAARGLEKIEWHCRNCYKPNFVAGGAKPKSTTMDSESTSSEFWRLEGNKFYKKASAPDITPAVRRSHLSSAMSAYNVAVTKAEGADQLSSATKNCALTLWKTASVSRSLQGGVYMLEYHYMESIKYFSKALVVGSNAKPSGWVDNLTKSYNSCIQEFLVVIANKAPMERVCALESMIHVMEEDTFKADCFLQMANIIFVKGIESIQEKNFRAALSMMCDCYRPIEEARRLANQRQYILDEVEVLEKDVLMQKCFAESLQSVVTGDDLLDKLLKDEEDLNVDGVYEVVDWYKKAVLLTREKEVEMEAIALSRLGKVYHKVLKQKTKAKENFMRAIQLAYSLHPRTFYSEEWFQLSSETLNHYQREYLRTIADEQQHERAKYLEELKKELKNLDKRTEKTNIEFMLYVYKTHPPKKETHKLATKAKLEKLSQSDVKKTLQKAILHYHPDKQHEETHGKKWTVLCEEITKRFTARYERLKG